MKNRRKRKYFEREEGAPSPVSASITHRCQFSETDMLSIVWYGRYAAFFEEASAELGRKIGLSYEAMRDAGVIAPIAQLHIDYHSPLALSEICTVTASIIWTEASRLNIEYSIDKEDGILASSGYTVQMFINTETNEVCLLPPPLFIDCCDKWKNGLFHG
ncbi:MAG: hypothetical protein A2020_15090 [Lentisphaerae bacterium GWF2_45_14]|nr:MAG: hypothetical protein A2020_15090 [Lentisphaerae bacterium GWF2_45_14]